MDMNLSNRQYMARAPHIQQVLRLESIVNRPDALPPRRGDQEPEAVRATRSLDQDLELLWMKFARYKDLSSFIQKVHGAGSTFPQSVLWRIFQCCE